jgi:hypothetical protein
VCSLAKKERKRESKALKRIGAGFSRGAQKAWQVFLCRALLARARFFCEARGRPKRIRRTQEKKRALPRKSSGLGQLEEESKKAVV